MMNKLALHLVSILIVGSLASCSSQKWAMIDSSINIEELLHDKFPSLYSQNKAGEIVIDKVEQSTDKNGATKYRVTYTTKSDDDDDSFLMETIYRPLLLN